jgi:hypothetical protein
MNMRHAVLLPIVSAFLCAGCGDDRGAAPTPVPSSVEIAGPSGHLFVGQTYQFQMDARMSDGTRVTTGGTWGSDAPIVAIDANGVVRVVGIGEATIFVDYQGQRATRRLRTTFLYEGQLDSSARGQRMAVTRCRGTGWWSTRAYCGSERTFATFTQQDNVVTAAITVVWDSDSFSESRFPAATAVIGATGELGFESLDVFAGDEVGTRWRLRPFGQTQVTGTFTVRVTDPARSGYLEWEEAIEPTSLTRHGASASRAMLPSPPIHDR